MNGQDLLTFNLRNYREPALILHTGQRLFEDPTGWLRWAADTRAVLLASVQGLFAERRAEGLKLIRTWIEQAQGSNNDKNSP